MPEITKATVQAAINAADRDHDGRINSNVERMLFNKALGGGLRTNGAYRVMDETVKKAFDNKEKYREGVTSAELREFFATKTKDGGFDADEFMAAINGNSPEKTAASQPKVADPGKTAGTQGNNAGQKGDGESDYDTQIEAKRTGQPQNKANTPIKITEALLLAAVNGDRNAPIDKVKLRLALVANGLLPKNATGQEPLLTEDIITRKPIRPAPIAAYARSAVLGGEGAPWDNLVLAQQIPLNLEDKTLDDILDFYISVVPGASASRTFSVEQLVANKLI